MRDLSSPQMLYSAAVLSRLDKMKPRQVHLDEAWSLKRDNIQVIKGGNEQTKGDTGPADLPHRAIDPTLPTANCSTRYML